MKETVATAKTIELAVSAACTELGVTPEEVEYTVLEEPKKGILGIGASDAKVSVSLKMTPALKAYEFIENIIKNMNLDASVEIVEKDEEGVTIAINGGNLGILIGRRGDVLDSLQYLATLAANIEKSSFYRVTVDVQGYREKRAETLRGVARRMSEKVLKYKRSFALEPMNAYERRIIHSECQNIAGVTTRSIGEGADRKIVISPEKK
ncbi:MAG: protein jag [Clostridia bacterium]|nr:protein jag [Clostridia bacterium]MBR6784181.1 protein jag [Clostridia bacterium]